MGRRRLVTSIIVAAAVVSFAAGCSRGQTSREGPAVEDRVRLRISGSGTGMPLLELLTAEYPDKDVEFDFLPGLHTGGGVKGVAQEALEIGATSRDLNDEEKALGVEQTVLSHDGLVMAVHPSVEIDGLTSQEVRDLYAGKYKNWKELGGNDLAIIVLDRNEDESAKMILRQYVLGDRLKISPEAVNMFYESDMVEALRTMPGAVGYFSLGYGISRRVPVRMLALDGVEASVESIEDGRYKVIRPLGIVTLPGRDADTQNAIDGFLKWTDGPEAEAMMRKNGFAPAK